MVIFLAMALPCLCKLITTPRELPDQEPGQEDLTISLITCYPGPEVYELCGHAAIRVRGTGIDSIWNFGIFDFNQPNFIYRFVKGETDYKCAAYPFAWFLPEYIQRGSKVVEQDLNLTPDESKKLLGLLRQSALPENATYRYNYIKDNCATRILDRVDEATDAEIIYPDSLHFGTFRKEMKAYHDGYPWYQFGIDLALGSGLDHQLTSREEMFVPVEMMRKAAAAHLADGRPLTKATRVLNDTPGGSGLPPTPWYAGPLFWSWIVFIALLCFAAAGIKRKRIINAVYIAWFSALGLAGLLVAFLVFISVHEATDPNVIILWINPLQFLMALGCAFRKLRFLSIAMAYYNIVVVGVLLIVSPFIIQSLNPAFYPLMGATVAMGGAYAIIGNKSSYKIKSKSKTKTKKRKK